MVELYCMFVYTMVGKGWKYFWYFEVWNGVSSKVEKSCLQELCKASISISKLSMVLERKRDETFTMDIRVRG